MTGREEKDKKIDESIVTMIRQRDSLRYLVDYEMSLSSEFDTSSHGTKKEYFKAALRFLDYLKLNRGYDISTSEFLKDIRFSDVDSYKVFIQKKRNGEDTSDAYKIQQICGVRRFLRFLYDYEYRTDDLSLRVKQAKYGSKESHKIIAMDHDEINIMRDNVKHGVGSDRAVKRQSTWKERDLALVNLGISTGIRVGALVEINIDDIDFEGKKIHVIEKRKRDRYIDISDGTVSILSNWILKRSEIMGDSDINALFVSNRKQRISVRAVEKIVEKYANGIDKHITPHKMRSTFATMALKESGDIYMVKELLGHRNIATTQMYAEVDKGNRRKLVEKIGGEW